MNLTYGLKTKDIILISEASKKDLPIARAFLKLKQELFKNSEKELFQKSEKEIIELFIQTFPDSDITGDIYLYGIEVPKDSKKAYDIYKNGNYGYKLGMYYLFYDQIDFSQALVFFDQDKNKDPRCKFASIILHVYINEEYYTDYEEDMIQLAKNGLPQAKYFLGDKNSGIEANFRVAFFQHGYDLVIGTNGEKRFLQKAVPFLMKPNHLGYPDASSENFWSFSRL